MTKIVYVDLNISPEVWTPPPGVLVRPLSEHPAIVEEKHLAGIKALPPKEKRQYRWKISPRRSETFYRIVDFLAGREGATVLEIRTALEKEDQAIRGILAANPEVFRKIGQQPSPSNRWNSQTVWGLVQP